MDSKVLLSVIVALLIAALLLAPWIRRKNAKIKAREEARKAQIEENKRRLHGKKLAVRIRTKGGQRTDLETELIDALVKCGATVLHIPEEILSGMAVGKKEGVPPELQYGIYGTSWFVEKSHGDGYSTSTDHMDCRVVMAHSLSIIGSHKITSVEKHFVHLSYYREDGIVATAVAAIAQSIANLEKALS